MADPPAPSHRDLPLHRRTWVRLVLGGAVLLLLSTALTTTFVAGFAARQLREAVLRAHQQVARRTADEIAMFYEAARANLGQMADVLRLLRREPFVREVYLRNGVLASDVFSTVVLMDEEGAVVVGTGLAGDDLSGFPPEARAKARAGTEWVSPVTLDSHEIPGLTFVVPVAPGSALLARLSLERIWRLVNDIDAGPDGKTYLVESNGTLVAGPDGAALLRRDIIDVSAPPPGRLYVTSMVGSPRWTVLISQPRASVYLPVDLVLRRAVSAGAIGLLLTLLVGGIVARLYARSLASLLDATLRVARGDFSRPVPVSATEFGVLAEAFNGMADRLRERTAALEESERRYRRVTESVGEIIYALDGAGRFTFLNSGVRRILGMEPSEMIGRPMTDFLLPSTRARKVEDLQRTLAGRNTPPVSGEAHAVARDGRTVILEYDSALSRDAAGVPQVYGIARDVTQRRALEERLRRSERLAALGEIVAKVAHELRNAVAGIAATMTLARDRVDAGQAHALDGALAEARRAQGIVEGLLGASRAQRPRQPCSLNEAVAAVLDARAGAAAAAGIDVQRALGPDLPQVRADPGLLRQVVHNIVDNAERALAGGPRPPGARVLRVHTWGSGNVVHAQVSDNGPGVDPEHRARVFDPFFTTRGAAGGAGLGLSISLGIVEELGGSIAVDGAPGAGAVFTVSLPSAEHPVTAPLTAARGREVLVVEDDEMLRDFIAWYLSGMGCAVRRARGAKEAVAVLERGTPCDLVVSDMQMADGDGRALHRWIAAHRPALVGRLLFVTGDALNPDTRAFLAGAGLPFLLKPVDASRLGEMAMRMFAPPS